MACPFLEEPVDIEAQILHRILRRERVIRPRLDVFTFPDDYLFEHYCFSAQSIIYLNDILSPHIVHMTHRGHALSSEQILCVALYCTLHFCGVPSHRPTRLFKEEFHRIAGFPGVNGCIDGTHIPITAPSVNEGDYVNRKSFHSINVQIICDAAHIISNMEAKWPGSVHDSQIFHECTLSARFAHGEFIYTVREKSI
ncbi:HARB1 nuclease, partial [Amia calva]|nr:HARB1 nuclease [Amia calva]